MKTIPKEYKLLKEISNDLNGYLKSPDTPVEIRSTELYEIIKKNSLFKAEFPTGKQFNQFLRKYHQNGILGTFLSYRVDTTNKNFYKWYFRKNVAKADNTPVNNETLEGNFNYYKDSKINTAFDGVKLNSEQEVYIYHQLKKCSHFLIKIEYPVTKFGETKYVDFLIQNKLTRKEFLWEHFGMTNKESYKSKMTDKIEWYINNGFRTVENGGNIIYTYYVDDNRLKKDVDKYIEIIKATPAL